MDKIRKGLETTYIQPNPLIKYDLPEMVKKQMHRHMSGFYKTHNRMMAYNLPNTMHNLSGGQ
jgi:hypothetical protein